MCFLHLGCKLVSLEGKLSNHVLSYHGKEELQTAVQV
jgi:hypothetical protein